MTRIRKWVLGLLLVSVMPAFAEEAADTAEPEVLQEPVEIPDPQVFVTQHTGTFNGVVVNYAASAGETYLRDEDGEPKASIFSFAYTRNGVDDPTQRPVMFIWNGGPGSASLWLHMGTFGPKRVVVPSDAQNAGAPPYPLVDNPLTLLDVTDLVFVDPVGTGFSRPLGKHEGKEFWGLDEDATSVADFIQQWITENGRWNSPKFIAGESFGTTRAAAVADILEGRRGISLNGIIMISQALDYTGSTPVSDNLVSFITYLPSMAATAAYHGKVAIPEGGLEAFLQEAREFAAGELAPALIKGSTLDDGERARIRDRLAYFIGLDPTYIERADLRVTGTRFLKELLRDEGLAAGRLDSRYTRDDIDDNADRPEADAGSDAISSAFTAGINTYMHDQLEVTMDRAYQPSGRLGGDWNWRPEAEGRYWEPSYVNVAPRLSNALRRNSDLRVLVASGYYDFATPFYDAEYTFSRHGILKDRIEYTYYEAGHMMYVHGPSLERFMADVRRFVVEAQSSADPDS
jgi:carboxypeptidase C (cathepsin A)